MQQENQDSAQSWKYSGETDGAPAEQQFKNTEVVNIEPIAWTGSEFLHRHKDVGWYLSLVLALVVVCAIIYFVSKDVLSVGFVAVMGILFGVVASRKPKELQYAIDTKGLQIGKRRYTYGDFRSFSVQRDGAIGYINLLPLKRLAPELSIYYPPEQEEKIFTALSEHIPHEQIGESMIDRLFKRFHF